MPECMPGSTIRLFPLNIVCDFDLFVAHHEVVHCLYGRFPLKEHGIDLFKARPLCDVRSQRGRFPSLRPTAGMPAAARTAGRRP